MTKLMKRWRKYFQGKMETEPKKKFLLVLFLSYPGETTPKSFLDSVSLLPAEPSIVVPQNAGKGGRNLHLGLEAIKNKFINTVFSRDLFLFSFASDGRNSDSAGAIVDKNTLEKSGKIGFICQRLFCSF